jgi:hypothetical protein
MPSTSSSRFRAEIIEFRRDDQRKITGTSAFHVSRDIDTLRNHLDHMRLKAEPLNRVLILETLGITAELNELLTKTYGIEDSFFAEHHTIGPKFVPDEARIKVFQLPTALAPEDRWHVDFFELYSWHCSAATAEAAVSQEGGVPLPCGNRAQVHKWKAQDQGLLLVVPTKCSYWSRRRDDDPDNNNSPWDGMITLIPSQCGNWKRQGKKSS